MADEVYDGAIGIDLGKLEIVSLNSALWVSLIFNRWLSLSLGTTYSCGMLYQQSSPPTHLGDQIEDTDIKIVANYEGTNVEIIANEQGSFTTPSFVSFTDKERLIGESAKNQAAMNPRNTIFDIKSVSLHSSTNSGLDKLTLGLQAFDRTEIWWSHCEKGLR